MHVTQALKQPARRVGGAERAGPGRPGVLRDDRSLDAQAHGTHHRRRPLSIGVQRVSARDAPAPQRGCPSRRVRAMCCWGGRLPSARDPNPDITSDEPNATDAPACWACDPQDGDANLCRGGAGACGHATATQGTLAQLGRPHASLGLARRRGRNFLLLHDAQRRGRFLFCPPRKSVHPACHRAAAGRA